MSKFIKYPLYGLGFLVIIGLLFLAYLAATFNANDFKDDIIKIVADKKERTLTIDGDIKLTFWPKIGANLGSVALSEHKSPNAFASVSSVKVALAVLPLLKKQLVIDTIYVDGANANIVKYKDGTTNFDDLLSEDKEESEIKFNVEGINMTNSQIKYLDQGTGAQYQVSKLNLQSGQIAIAKPIDLNTTFTLSANQPKMLASTTLKGNFLIDPKTKHFVVKGLDSTVQGEMLGGTGISIKASGDVDAKPELMEFLVNNLKVVGSGIFNGAKQAIDLNAPALTILKESVNSAKVSLSVSQEKNGEQFRANMVLADMKGSTQTLQSSGITGDLSAVQGKRTIIGKFSSPFKGNIEELIFDIPKLVGNLTINDPSLPNGSMQGTFNVAAHADIKKELADSQFNLNLADTKLAGDISVTGFKPAEKITTVKFNLNADQLDLNKLLAKSSSPSNASKNPAQNKPADLSLLKNISLDGKLNVGRIIYDKYRVSGLNVGIKADGKALALNGLNVGLNESQIKGNVGITNFTKPLYTFNLDIDALDLDQYMSAKPTNATKQKASDKPLDLSVLKGLNAEGKLRIGSLKYGKTRASNVNINLVGDGQKLSLNPLSAKVDESQISGSVGVTQFDRPKFLFDLTIDAVNADRYNDAESQTYNNKTTTQQSGELKSGGSNSSSSKSNGLSVLKNILADGRLKIGRLKYDRYQISNLNIGLKSDGQQLSLNPFSAKIDDSQVIANLAITQFEQPNYIFDLKIDRLDADRYLTKNEPKTKNTGDTPIDLSALKKLNASGEAKIGWLKLANIKTENVNLGLKAAGGVATLSPFEAKLYQGTMSGLLSVDARNTPNITFKQSMKNVLVGPLMVDAINNDLLSGKGSIAIDVSTQGNSVDALKKALLGTASLNLADGALKGVDIAGSLRDLKNKINIFKNKDSISGDDKKKTDFSELTATFNIKNGVAHNDDLAMKAPVLRLAKGDSRGDIDIGNETINYVAKPSIVKSLKGQGGAELNDLSGLAIPVKITGTFADPKFGMDFAAIASALAQSKLLDKVGGEKGAAIKELIGGGDKVEALKGLLGKKKPSVPNTDSAPSANASPNGISEGTEVPPAEKPKSLKDEAKEKVLEKLFKF